MKKILALITLIVLTTVSSYSQGQNITVETDNETVIALTALANKMGTTAEYLWKVLVKQAPLEAVKEGITLLIMLTIGGVFYRAHLALIKKKAYSKNTFLDVWVVTAALIWGVITTASIYFTVSACIDALNPEYWALKQILEQLK